MRTLAALLLVLVACAPSDRADDPSLASASAATSPSGPEPLVLRVPRSGGRARVHAYPQLDSVMWTSGVRVPAGARVLAFNDDQGSIALVDSAGRPAWIDLRLGALIGPRDVRLREAASADGMAIVGVSERAVVRVSPSGEPWRFVPPAPPTRVLPQPEGGLLVLAAADSETTQIWRLRPPATRLLDTAAVPRADRAALTSVGDRLYLAAGAELLALQGRDLEPLPAIDFDGPVRALAATPSGDRVFVVTEGRDEVAVVDRYEEDVVRRIRLPGPARDLRVDPYGRVLLARPASGDSIWVVALATGELAGTVRGSWRSDLPAVFPDGVIAVAAGADVRLLAGESLQPVRTVAGGAADLWYPFLWDGYRPRPDAGAAVADAPPRLEPAPPSDVEPSIPGDTLAVAAPDADSVPAVGADSVAGAAAPAGFMVSFAALLSEADARELAARIEVDGARPRVAVSERAGTRIYRVLLGPYPTREDAERVGRAAGQSYWVYAENR